MKKAIVLCIGLLISAGCYGAYDFDEDAKLRVETGVRYAIVTKEGAELRQGPFKNAPIWQTVKAGSRAVVDWRNAKKDTIEGITDYWYGVSVSGRGGAWIFGGYLKKDKYYSLPWDSIYQSNSKYDKNEVKRLFPTFAYIPTDSIAAYKDEDLKEVLVLNVNPGYRIKLVGRREKGIDLEGCKIEVFKLQVPDKEETYFVKGTDIVREDNIFGEPLAEKPFCAGVIGSAYYEPGGCWIDLFSVWFKRQEGGFAYIGMDSGEKPIAVEWLPNKKYFVSRLFDPFNKYYTTIFNNNGDIIFSTNMRLASAVQGEENEIFIRGVENDDSVYCFDLITKKINKIFEIINDGEIQGSEGDEAAIWKPVIYNRDEGTITAEFERTTSKYNDDKFLGAILKTITVKFDRNGKVISRLEKEEKYRAP